MAFGEMDFNLRVASGQGDLDEVCALRSACFRPGNPEAGDLDTYDEDATHLMVRTDDGGVLVGCCRLTVFDHATDLSKSYSAQFYDLSDLALHSKHLIEIGRFCINPKLLDPNILRTMWAGITKLSDELGTEFLFGCSSFPSLEPADHADALSFLFNRHIAPNVWAPRKTALSNL